MPDDHPEPYRADCGSRLLIDQMADKWSMLILASLCGGPLRFNAIRRRIEGITQKALTQALRRLERNGILEREVIASSPVAVEYRITPLGRSLQVPMQALMAWTMAHGAEVEAARQAFDGGRTEAGGAPEAHADARRAA